MNDYPGGFEPPSMPPAGPPPFDPGSTFVGLPLDGTFSPVPEPRGARPWVTIALSLAIVGMVAGILVTVLGPSSNASAIVANAVTSAIGDQTARVQVTETVGVAGQTVTLSGGGALDFSSGDVQLNLSGTDLGQSTSVTVVDIGDTIYVNVPQAAQIDGGKPWLSLNASSFGQSAAAGVPGTGGNPAALLQALAQQGNDVSSIGTSTVDGQQVQGYSVTITPDALNAALNSSSVPSWAKQAAQSVKFQSASVKVYVSSAGDLVRLEQGLSASAAGQTLNETLAMDFSDYGTPVSVTAPPADQVTSFQDFLQAIANTEQS